MVDLELKAYKFYSSSGKWCMATINATISDHRHCVIDYFLFIPSKYDQADYASVFKILDVAMCAFLPSVVDTRGRHLSADLLFCSIKWQHNNYFQILMYKLIVVFMYLSVPMFINCLNWPFWFIDQKPLYSVCVCAHCHIVTRNPMWSTHFFVPVKCLYAFHCSH